MCFPQDKHPGVAADPDKCESCDFRCKKTDILLSHRISEHGAVAPYSCELCDFKTALRPSLPKHMRSMHTKRACHLCDFTTDIGANLAIHLKSVHRPRCTLCNFTPKRGKTLDGHRCEDYLGRKTGRNQTFQCPHCVFHCIKTANLRIHIENVHEKLHQVKCPQCGKTIRSSSGLRKHVRDVHEETKELDCNRCDFKTNYSHHLRRHMRSRHGVVLP